MKTTLSTPAVRAIGLATMGFLILPILVVVPSSFNEQSFIRLPPTSYSMRWYSSFIADPEWMTAAFNSLRIGVVASFFSVVIGTAAALGISRLNPRLRKLAFALFLAPLIVPTIMIAISLYQVMRTIGLYGTTVGLALTHAVICLPFVILNVGVSLQSFDPALMRAAEGLGAGPWFAFRTVLLPALVPGLVAGAIFAFATSFEDVVLALFMAGAGTKTLPVKLWEVIQLEITPASAVASTLILGVTLVLFAGAQVVRRRQPRALASSANATEGVL